MEIYFTGPGPPVSGPRRFPSTRAVDRAHVAHHQPTHLAVTALMVESTQAPVTVGRRRCPCQGGLIQR
jgi:hypothetical protein